MHDNNIFNVKNTVQFSFIHEDYDNIVSYKSFKILKTDIIEDSYSNNYYINMEVSLKEYGTDVVLKAEGVLEGYDIDLLGKGDIGSIMFFIKDIVILKNKSLDGLAKGSLEYEYIEWINKFDEYEYSPDFLIRYKRLN